MQRLYNWFESLLNPFQKKPINISAKSTTIEILLEFAKQAKYLFLILLALGFIGSCINVAVYYQIGQIIDHLKEADITKLDMNAILSTFGILVLLILCRPIFNIPENLVSDLSVGTRFSALVRWSSHRRLLLQPPFFFQNNHAGNIASKIWQSGQVVYEFILSIIKIVWSNSVYVFTMLIALSMVDWRLSFVIAIWITFFVFFARYFIPRIVNKARVSAAASNELNGHLVDTYSNIHSVKLFSPKDLDASFLKEKFHDFINKATDFLESSVSSKISLIILNSFAIVVIALLSGYLWLRQLITIGDVAFSLGLSVQLEGILTNLLGQLTQVFRSYGSVQASFNMIQTDIMLKDSVNALDMTYKGGEVNFQDIHFTYKGRIDRQIADFSLLVAPGEKIGIVGKSGSGKTTIFNLLLRFYDVDSGSIEIDGQDIRDIKQNSLREHVGLVTQDPILFHRSIYDNITFGIKDISMEKVVQASKDACAFDFIKNLKDTAGRVGFDAHVGDRGIQLSGGQRQRISLARVLLKGSPILLLDEATSALDSSVELEIQSSLLNAMKGKTVIVIAHRLSTITNMDRLVVMDNGRVVECGTHNELLSTCGLYAEFWQRQNMVKKISSSSESVDHPREERNVVYQ